MTKRNSLRVFLATVAVFACKPNNLKKSEVRNADEAACLVSESTDLPALSPQNSRVFLPMVMTSETAPTTAKQVKPIQNKTCQLSFDCPVGRNETNTMCVGTKETDGDPKSKSFFCANSLSDPFPSASGHDPGLYRPGVWRCGGTAQRRDGENVRATYVQSLKTVAEGKLNEAKSKLDTMLALLNESPKDINGTNLRYDRKLWMS